ncbi:FlgO family outer membrane protein [Thalassotalea sp. SU-HH00458]|uniref:FlgO family outer membrane protein n=1 Tax=Thalassotalea sp. SU-HH00458 TaxID=3127657 RepID=UPI003109E9F8
MKQCIYLLLSLLVLSCSTIDESEQDFTRSKQEISKVNQAALIERFHKIKDLSFYIKQMTNELLSNIEHVKPNSVIATSSFVYVDGDFKKSPLFAKQIQESFTYEFHKVGQPIVAFKATGFIRVTEQGDFAVSRDFTELKQKQPIDYILVGTLAKRHDGVQVNAKLVGVKTNVIVAAAQQVIPKRVIELFLSSVPPKAPKGQLIELK